MISNDTLMAVKTLVVHDSCADGLASALLLRDALPSAELRFVQYGTPAHKELAATSGMLFCDFSPPLERADEFARAGAIVLDHHRTAEAAVAKMGERGVFGDEATEPGVCGAVLALRHVWRPLRAGAVPANVEAFAESFAAVAGVRDTWQTKDSRWRAACAQSELLWFLPRDVWLAQPLAEIARTWDADVLRFGESLLQKQEERVTRALRDALSFTAASGLRIVVFEGPSLSSDAAERMGEGADVIVAFGFSVEGGVQKMRVSLRSHTGFDCRTFAEKRGGGGHTAAAGFAVPLSDADVQPYALVRAIFS